MRNMLARIASSLLVVVLIGATGSAHAQDRDREPSGPVVPLVVGGAGVVVLGLGGLFALRASSARDDATTAEEHATAFQRSEDARSLTNTANALLLTGSAILLVGVAWTAVVLAEDDGGSGSTSLLIGPGSLALRGEFH